MNYPGGKNGSGVYQRIISLMPKHKVYIEAFLGSGAIFRRKKTALENIGVDLDADLIHGHYGSDLPLHFNFNLKLFDENFVEWIKTKPGWITGKEKHFGFKGSDVLIYADPPYLRSVRSSKTRIYKHEFWTDTEHIELLTALKSLKSMVMISGYKSDLYAQMLEGWRLSIFRRRTAPDKR